MGGAVALTVHAADPCCRFGDMEGERILYSAGFERGERARCTMQISDMEGLRGVAEMESLFCCGDVGGR